RGEISTAGEFDVAAARGQHGGRASGAADGRALGRATAAAGNATDNRAQARTGADLRRVLAACGFTLERDGVGADVVALPVDACLGESQRQARAPFHPPGALHLDYLAGEDRAGRQDLDAFDQHTVAQTRADRSFDRG